MRLQLYHSNSFTATGLKSGKVHKLSLCGNYRDLEVKVKLHTLNCTHKYYILKFYPLQFKTWGFYALRYVLKTPII